VEGYAVKERGILFSAPMVRAILDGTKTQTRRVVKPAPTQALDTTAHVAAFIDRVPAVEGGRVVGHTDVLRKCPYGKPGDRLWVRETWGLCRFGDTTDWYRGKVGPTREGDPLREANRLEYRADHGPQQEHCFWRPSLFMPRWASRITLEITNVRVERVQSISDADIRAEGVTAEAVRELLGCGHAEVGGGMAARSVPIAALSPRELWRIGWIAINGVESWDSNVWLWCITFRRVQP
jgi:hypothetical protein